MTTLKTFETKEEKLKREIEELLNQIPHIDEEIEVGKNRFDMKLNNVGTITEDDVRGLFTGLLKKNKILDQAFEKRNQIDGSLADLPTLDDIVQEVFEIEEWENRKYKNLVSKRVKRR